MISSKQSLKNDIQNFLLQKIKNAPNIWFPHRFSILAQNVAPKRLVDAPDPQEAANQVGSAQSWPELDFLCLG